MRAAMSAIDAALLGHILRSKALVRIEKPRHRQPGGVSRKESRRVLRTQPEWQGIGLRHGGEETLPDAVLPCRKHAPFGGDEVAFDEAVRTRRPVVGDVTGGSAVRMETVRVRVPMVLGGEVRYVLSVPLQAGIAHELLQAQRLPHDWVIRLTDFKSKIIVRIPSVAPGNAGVGELSPAVAESPELVPRKHARGAGDLYPVRDVAAERLGARDRNTRGDGEQRRLANLCPDRHRGGERSSRWRSDLAGSSA